MPNDEPVVITTSPKSKIPMLLILSLVAVLLTAIVIFTIYQKPPAKQLPAIPPSQPSPIPSVNPATPRLIFSCPVAKNLCKEADQITYKGNSALAYLLPSGTKLLRIVPITSSKKIDNSLFEAFIFQNKDCYLITYTFPTASGFAKLTSPYRRTDIIGTTATDFLNISVNNTSKKANLILQIQKFSLNDPTDSKSCDLTQREPKDFGSYQTISTQTFE